MLRYVAMPINILPELATNELLKKRHFGVGTCEQLSCFEFEVAGGERFRGVATPFKILNR
jgi:hypothetical protein